jgi:hypothetical protein
MDESSKYGLSGLEIAFGIFLLAVAMRFVVSLL